MPTPTLSPPLLVPPTLHVPMALETTQGSSVAGDKVRGRGEDDQEEPGLGEENPPGGKSGGGQGSCVILTVLQPMSSVPCFLIVTLPQLPPLLHMTHTHTLCMHTRVCTLTPCPQTGMWLGLVLLECSHR